MTEHSQTYQQTPINYMWSAIDDFKGHLLSRAGETLNKEKEAFLKTIADEANFYISLRDHRTGRFQSFASPLLGLRAQPQPDQPDRELLKLPDTQSQEVRKQWLERFAKALMIDPRLSPHLDKGRTSRHLLNLLRRLSRGDTGNLTPQDWIDIFSSYRLPENTIIERLSHVIERHDSGALCFLLSKTAPQAEPDRGEENPLKMYLWFLYCSTEDPPCPAEKTEHFRCFKEARAFGTSKPGQISEMSDRRPCLETRQDHINPFYSELERVLRGEFLTDESPCLVVPIIYLNQLLGVFLIKFDIKKFNIKKLETTGKQGPSKFLDMDASSTERLIKDIEPLCGDLVHEIEAFQFGKDILDFFRKEAVDNCISCLETLGPSLSSGDVVHVLNTHISRLPLVKVGSTAFQVTRTPLRYGAIDEADDHTRNDWVPLSRDLLELKKGYYGEEVEQFVDQLLPPPHCQASGQHAENAQDSGPKQLFLLTSKADRLGAQTGLGKNETTGTGGQPKNPTDDPGARQERQERREVQKIIGSIQSVLLSAIGLKYIGLRAKRRTVSSFRSAQRHDERTVTLEDYD